jgi:NADH:ubiquinone oxidoreductase subunit 2 (subunit N)
MVRSLAPMVIIDVALPLITYFGLRAAGVGQFAAYLISGIWPLLKLVVGAVRKRSIDAFSILILVFIVLGAVTALVTGDVRTLLVRDSITTGGFGLVCLVTLVMARPLMF